MLCKDSARREQGKGKASVFIAVAYTLGLPGIAYWMNVISQSGSPGRGRRPKLHSIQFLWFRKGHGAEGPCAGKLEGGCPFGGRDHHPTTKVYNNVDSRADGRAPFRFPPAAFRSCRCGPLSLPQSAAWVFQSLRQKFQSQELNFQSAALEKAGGSVRTG